MNKLTPTELMEVEIPLDSEIDMEPYFPINGETKRININSESAGLFSLYTGLKDFEILGTVSKDSISFDLKPYLRVHTRSVAFSVPMPQVPIPDKLTYWNYNIGMIPNVTSDGISINESFYSLLESNERYFVNPMEKPDLSEYKGFKDADEYYIKHLSDWQSYENKIIKGKLLILKPKN